GGRGGAGRRSRGGGGGGLGGGGGRAGGPGGGRGGGGAPGAARRGGGGRRRGRRPPPRARAGARRGGRPAGRACGARGSSTGGDGRELVASAPHGLEKAGVARVVPELGPQPGDVHVDRPVEGLLGAAPDELEEALAGDDVAGAFREDAQQVELVGGEGQLAPPQRGPEGLGIEGELAHNHLTGGGAGLSPRPPDLGLDAGEELSR